MIYMHENNILTKIKNKKNKNNSLKTFYKKVYIPMRKQAESFDFSLNESFETFATLMNDYDSEVSKFEEKNNISYQAKLKSSFYEEMSCYLFKNLLQKEYKNFDIFNKDVCIGIFLSFENNFFIERKNVDFCIGQKVKVEVSGQEAFDIIKPIVAVEVKTYTDSTMFGEIQYSSNLLRGVSPYAKTYVLMGYNAIGKEHMVKTKYIPVNQMFALRSKKNEKMEAQAFKEYYNEIYNTLKNYGSFAANIGIGSIINK